MALVRFDPAREMEALQGEMNRLFGGFFGDVPARGAMTRWIPAMDLYEQGDEYVLEGDLPGMDEQDINIEYQDGILTVSGERQWTHEQGGGDGERYARRERSYGSFSRSITIPDIDPDAIEASFERGVLKLRIPKPTEQQPKRITIGGGDRRGDAGGNGSSMS